MLIDVRTNLDVEGLQALRANGLSVAVLDDVSDRRLVADLAFYSPASQAEALKWYGRETKVLNGWQWVAMSPALSEAGENAVATQTQALQGAVSDMGHSHLRMLVSFDGDDAQDLTWKTARRLVDLLSERDKVSKSTFDVTFSVDKSAENGRYTAMRIASLDRRFKAIDTSEDIIAEAASCDMAIVSFGVRAYEMGYLGKPTVLVCQDAEHSEAASAFVQAGIAKRTLADVMGPGRAFNEQVEQWLDHGNARREAGLKARALIDGGGAYRIAETIATHVAMVPQLEADVA